MHRTLPVLPSLALILVPFAATAEPPAALDACVECHGVDGMGPGEGETDPRLPVLAGIPAVHVQDAIYAYVDGARRCEFEPRMCEVVEPLTDEAIAAIADHYARQEREPTLEPFDADLAEAGARLHEDACADCHLPPGDPDIEYAIGIPLHGQRRAYLHYALEAYLSGARQSLLPAMAEEIGKLSAGDVDALVHYYASYPGTAERR